MSQDRLAGMSRSWGGGVSRRIASAWEVGRCRSPRRSRLASRSSPSFGAGAPRPEFWWFALLYYLVIFAPIVPLIAVGSVGRGDQPWDEADLNVAGVVFGIVIGVAVLALIIPYLAVGTRRLHDTGKPGWWWFITLVPFGSIILIVFWASEGDKWSNQYGPPPGAQAVQPAPPDSFPPPPPPPSPQ